MRRHSLRRGFTLIEVLVVIFILAILLGILLPSVQHVRHAAIRTDCQNNMRQVGVALLNYYDERKAFPPGLDSTMGPADFMARNKYYVSWMARILPYLEREGLSRRISGEYTRLYDPWGFKSDGKMRPHEALGVEMPIFYCSAEERSLLNHTFDYGRGFTAPVAFTCYLGNSGTRCGTNDGILYDRSVVSVAMIKDGASNTLLVGERPPSADLIFGWWYAGAGYYDLKHGQVGVGDVVLGVRETGYAAAIWNTGAVCSMSKVNFQPGSISNPCDQLHFWSYHPGGSNFLFADGSVHFLSYSADHLLPALATRAGGEKAPVIE